MGGFLSRLAPGKAKWKGHFDEGQHGWELYNGTSGSKKGEALQKCIEAYKQAVKRQPKRHKDRMSTLIGLVYALLAHCNTEGHEAHLAEAKKRLEELAQGNTPLPLDTLHELKMQVGDAHLLLFNLSGKNGTTDLEQCLRSYQEALKAATGSLNRRLAAGIKLGVASLEGGRIEHISEAIRALSKIQGILANPDLFLQPEPFKLLNLLSELHYTRYQHTRNAVDFDAAIQVWEGVGLLDWGEYKEGQVTSLVNLATVIEKGVRLSGAPTEVEGLDSKLQRAVECSREAIGRISASNLATEQPEFKLRAHRTLADALLFRNSKTGPFDPREIDECIDSLFEIKAHDPDAFEKDPDPEALSNLADAIRLRLRCENDLPPREGVTFEDAVALYKQALAVYEANKADPTIIAGIYGDLASMQSSVVGEKEKNGTTSGN
ncbi:hypothetical protein FA15DRAFT_672190 [Coprinopsis marcescibilis]|uniref:TPR-like protein n=1 Tax=Coprinopsis marcescibilis TaxID=230819 RepID=A0A5C3L0V3_COPMA|nr:hypothetical protein FA15DRAFT_672190 [Coprinopsis marcescibilis]